MAIQKYLDDMASSKVNPVSTSSRSKVGGLGVIAPVPQSQITPNPYNTGPLIRQAPQQPATPNFGIGGPTGGGMGGDAPAAPQSKPVMSEGDWLAGDGEYQDQMTEYDNTLKDFLARLTTQESDFDTDFGVAQQGFQKNKERGLLGIGEDFTSRGLANSGMFAQAQNEGQEAFKAQENGLNTSKTRAKADFGTQRQDKQRATDQARGNAKKGSLGRMAMDQAF